jgi:hypothetical protein
MYAAAIKPIIVNGKQSMPGMSVAILILIRVVSETMMKTALLHTGTSFTYIRASLLLVQDQTTIQQPPFQFDTTLGHLGFVDLAGSPVTVTLTTKVLS